MSVRPITRRGIVDTTGIVSKSADKGGEITLAGPVKEEEGGNRNIQHSETAYLSERASHVEIKDHGGYWFNLKPGNH